VVSVLVVELLPQATRPNTMAMARSSAMILFMIHFLHFDENWFLRHTVQSSDTFLHTLLKKSTFILTEFL
jgi:hypothetical protein